MAVTIEVLDPTDHGAFVEFYDVYRRSNERAIDQPWLPDELKVLMVGDEYLRNDSLLARQGDTAVGVAIAELPERDNVTTVYAEVWVPPELRRRGYGRALLERLELRAAEDGRERILTETLRPIDDETSPAREFMLAHGYSPDTTLLQRELALPADTPPADVRDGYTLAAWRAAPPPQWLEEYARLRALLNQEMPAGETQLENEYWDPDRLLHEVDQWKRQGRTAQTVVAVAPDGHLAGHTQLLFPAKSTEVYQWDTLVLPEHRGHGLGLALKRHAMREAADLLEGRTRVVTWNDAQNDHMIAVNEALGYRATAWADQWVKNLG
ncbi:GNAT family N-acetyltransferase [Aeromicrobium duanguangcaii]|uniref:GNAT family N-acetyltransferase n=1 Tax=Aeromicrobium duanguangcaii TaxID=2968086 RepID=UPI0020170468|nr:GNAT family N-acetyltransferase [Aeromicrobium duanguangcaii]MCL3837579.1 GNAT family N-acetyltransferase [Aeromicrobium duanguangcaii]